MLAARFHTYRDRALAAVDRTFAEPVRLHPMAKGAADSSRPVVTIEAVLRVGGGKEVPPSGRASDASWRMRVAAQRAELHIDRAKYANLVCRQGDKIRAIARPGEPWFEVLAVEDRGESRLVLEMGEA